MISKSCARAALVLLGAAALVQLSCSGGDESNVAITLNDGQATTQTIGVEGGTITAGDLRLDIPKGALLEDIEITMTPVASIAGTPLDEGFAAGAHFEPDDLRFFAAATLTMPAPEATSDEIVVGFGAAGDGSDLHLAAHQAHTATVSMPVWHFSLSGTARAQLNELELLYVVEPGPDHLLAEHRIAVADAKLAAAELGGVEAEIAAATITHQDEIIVALRAWFTESIKTGFSIVEETVPFYEFVTSDWLAWVATVDAYRSAVNGALAPELAEATALAEAGGARIALSALERCNGDDLDREVADLARIAQILAITTVDISKQTVDGTPGGRPVPGESALVSSCVSVSITDVEHPRRLLAGTDNPFTVRVQAEFWSAGVRSDVPLHVRHLRPATGSTSVPTVLSEETVTNGRWELEVSAAAVPEDSFESTILSFDVTLAEGLDDATAETVRSTYSGSVSTFNRLELMGKRAADPNYRFLPAQIAPSETIDLRALLSGADDTGVQLAYALEGSGALSETAGTSNGLGRTSFQYTASSDASSRATVTVSIVDGDLSDSFLIEVGEPAQVEIIPGEVTLEPGGTQQFSAEVDAVASTDISWSATGGAITQDGLFTAGSTSGEFTVTASPNDRPGIGIAFVDIAGGDELKTGVYLGTYLDTSLVGGPERPAAVLINSTGPSTYLIGVAPIRNDGSLGGSLDYNATHSGSQLTGESTVARFFDGEFIFPYFEATVSGDNLKGFGQYYINSDADHKCGDGHCGYEFDVTWDRETL